MAGHKLSNKNHIHIHIGDKDKRRRRRRHRKTGGVSRGGGVYVTNHMTHSAPVLPLFNRPQTLDATLGDERERARQNPFATLFRDNVPTNTVKTEFKENVPPAPAAKSDFTPQNTPTRRPGPFTPGPFTPGPFSSPLPPDSKRTAPFQTPTFQNDKRQAKEAPSKPFGGTNAEPKKASGTYAEPPATPIKKKEPKPAASFEGTYSEPPLPRAEPETQSPHAPISAPEKPAVVIDHIPPPQPGPFEDHSGMTAPAVVEPRGGPFTPHRPRIVHRQPENSGQYEVFSQSGYRRGPFTSDALFTAAKYEKQHEDKDIKDAYSRRHGGPK